MTYEEDETASIHGEEDEAPLAAEKSLPFAAKVPNKTTVEAMRAADGTEGKRLNSADALFKDLGV